MKQHIDSYNYFVETDIVQIMKANQRVTCESDSSWFLKYTNIYVDKPCIDEDTFVTDITPGGAASVT